MTRQKMVDTQVQRFEQTPARLDRTHWGQDTEAKQRRALRLAQDSNRRHSIVWDEKEAVYVGRWI